MKIKTIVLGWILMSIAQVASSQVSFGVQGGVAFFRAKHFGIHKNLTNPDLLDIPISGYYVALVTNIPIKNKFSIQGELSLIQKGRSRVKRFDYPNPNFDWSFQIKDRYLFVEVPIMGRYYVPISKRFHFELGLGASVGYLAQYKLVLRENDNTTTTIVELQNPCANCSSMNSWDISPILDISFPVQAPFGEFIAGLRSSIDLKKSRSLYEFQGQTFSRGESYNWGTTLYVGYSFNKKNIKKHRVPKSELE